jgi:hypothetical protein
VLQEEEEEEEEWLGLQEGHVACKVGCVVGEEWELNRAVNEIGQGRRRGGCLRWSMLK